MWRLHFVCRYEIDPEPPGDGVAGVDLGISNFAAVSFGDETMLYPGGALNEDEYRFHKKRAEHAHENRWTASPDIPTAVGTPWRERRGGCHTSRSSTAAPTASVVAVPPRSGVCGPSASTVSTAPRTSAAAVSWPRKSSSIAADSTVASGFATP